MGYIGQRFLAKFYMDWLKNDFYINYNEDRNKNCNNRLKDSKINEYRFCTRKFDLLINR